MIRAGLDFKQSSDHELAKRVTKSLERQVALRGIDIDIINGVVYLCGTVRSAYQRRLAMGGCARVPGVVDVVDHLFILDDIPCDGRFECTETESCTCRLNGRCPTSSQPVDSANASTPCASLFG